MDAVPRGIGFTTSEKFVAELADRAFLRLWAYPNTFIDKLKAGKGVGKEFADLLVVFGDDVLIFSVKDCEWPNSDDPNLAWTRWFRRAVENSAKQLMGAQRWLTDFEDRIFLDPECKQKFPYDFPPSDRRRVHCISVAFGATKAARKHFDDDSGTFFILPHIEGRNHTNPGTEGYMPFAVGDIDPQKPFVHVFDPQALGIVLSELDTADDFVQYIKSREDFIRSGRLAMAAGEEELLAHYLQVPTDAFDRHHFGLADLPSDFDDHLISIPNGQYQGLVNSSEYSRKKAADKVSYAWDHLIDNFIQHVLAGTSVEILDTQPTVPLAERGLRLMAAEPRIYRRVLGQSFLEAMQEAEAKAASRFVRVVKSPSGRTLFVFLILAYPKEELENGYDQYRQVRSAILETYCMRAFRQMLGADYAVGVAIDASPAVSGVEGGSEDLVALAKPDWTPETLKQFRAACDAYDIKPNRPLKKRYVSDTEFPLDQEPPKNRAERRARRADSRRSLRRRAKLRR